MSVSKSTAILNSKRKGKMFLKFELKKKRNLISSCRFSRCNSFAGTEIIKTFKAHFILKFCFRCHSVWTQSHLRLLVLFGQIKSQSTRNWVDRITWKFQDFKCSKLKTFGKFCLCQFDQYLNHWCYFLMLPRKEVTLPKNLFHGCFVTSLF